MKDVVHGWKVELKRLRRWRSQVAQEGLAQWEAKHGKRLRELDCALHHVYKARAWEKVCEQEVEHRRRMLGRVERSLRDAERRADRLWPDQ